MSKVSTWKRVIWFGKPGKVNPQYILTRIGHIAYRLKLPQELNNVHDTFHVPNLKMCLSDDTLVSPLDEI